MSFYERTEKLIGGESLEKLKKAHVAVFGVGGVGGYAAEMLVRAGVGEITICDFDVVSKSNINRQIIALNSTVGKKKVNVLEERLKDINKNLKINIIDKRFSKENVNEFNFKEFCYVVDAIDSAIDKLNLILAAKMAETPIISSMGSGNRFKELPHFVVKDIYKTAGDGLAKKMRKLLKDNNVKGLDVATSENMAEKVEGEVASISYYPAAAGCVLAAFVVNKLIN